MDGRAKNLTLSQKTDVLKHIDENVKFDEIARKFGIGMTTVYNIRSQRDSILSNVADNLNGKRKRMRLCPLGNELDKRLLAWHSDARAHNIPVSDSIMQEKARHIAAEIRYSDFKGSNGWLQRFKQRWGLSSRKLSGESASMDEAVVNSWKRGLPVLLSGYELKDIFNCDETGLFFRAMPDRSLVRKGDMCKGGKLAKERVTVLFTCSATGEKMRPYIIWKSANPRCFARRPPQGVDYFANKKAWMTTTLFSDYLKDFNDRMVREKRYVLLLLDNAPVHPNISLSNVRLQFLPKNTTAGTQPLDAGIIRNFKYHYRLLFVNHLIKFFPQRRDDETMEGLVKRTVPISVAIYWIKSAWDDVKAETIVNCFRHCSVHHYETQAASTTEEAIEAVAEEEEEYDEHRWVDGSATNIFGFLSSIGIPREQFMYQELDVPFFETGDNWESAILDGPLDRDDVSVVDVADDDADDIGDDVDACDANPPTLCDVRKTWLAFRECFVTYNCEKESLCKVMDKADSEFRYYCLDQRVASHDIRTYFAPSSV